MNIQCLICTDIFTPSSDIYTTPCGHIFHFHCLLHWLDNSKTCPQCRTKTRKDSLIRLYITAANSQGIEGDVTVLQHKLDGLEFQLRLKDKDIKNFTEKYRNIEDQNKALRLKVKELELDDEKHQSVQAALQDQIKYFKSKARDGDKLSEEVKQLKNEIKNLENIQVAVKGSRKEVEEIIRVENNIESLALLAATLKKTLVDTDRRTRELRLNLKEVKNALSKEKANNAHLNCTYEDTKRKLQTITSNYEKETAFLKEKFAQLQSKTGLNDSVNDSIKRIMLESPVNYHRTPVVKTKESKVIDLTNSPASQSVSDTPKSNCSMIDDEIVMKSPLAASRMGVLAIHRAKMMSETTHPNKFSIFKNKPPPQFEPLDLPSTTNKKTDVSYDGLGGSNKEDIFPSPQKISLGLKRPKSSKISSAKFKKLSADAGKPNRKMSDFF